MTNRISYFRAAALAVLALTVIIATADTSRGDEPSKSLTVIKTALPDSLALEGKVVYVDFWASWCVPCRQSFPWMQRVYEDHRREGFEIVAVNVDRKLESAREFLDEHPVPFAVIFDSTGDLAKQFGLEAMPTSFIYDRRGSLVTEHRGFRADEAAATEDSIRVLLAGEDSE